MVNIRILQSYTLLAVWKCDKVAFKTVTNISKCCYVLVGRA